MLRILGVEADLDGVAVDVDVGLRETQLLARGDAELVGDQVAARRELGDRVLDLEPRVHLEERERAPVVQQELAGPGAHVADGTRQREGRFAHRSAQRGVDRGGGRLLGEPSGGAAGSSSRARRGGRRSRGCRTGPGDLDVPGAFEKPLEDEPVVVEGGPRLASGCGELCREAVGEANRAHALAAATGRRFRPARDSRCARPPW